MDRVRTKDRALWSKVGAQGESHFLLLLHYLAPFLLKCIIKLKIIIAVMSNLDLVDIRESLSTG